MSPRITSNPLGRPRSVNFTRTLPTSDPSGVVGDDCFRATSWSSTYQVTVRVIEPRISTRCRRPEVDRFPSNASAHLVSAILTEALRQADESNPRTALDDATEKLFEPLGIDTRNPYTARFHPDHPAPFDRAGFGWATDAQAINIGAGQLRLRPADLLKIGQLYLNHGQWQDQQLVPAEWVTASVAPSPRSDLYGLMWWLEKTPSGAPAYAARGFGGQLIVVVPAEQLVVVVTAKPTNDYATNSDSVFALVSEVILTTLHR